MKDTLEILWELFDSQPGKLKSGSIDMANYAQILMNRLARHPRIATARLGDVEARISYIHKAMLYYDIGTMLCPSEISEMSQHSDCRHPRTGVDYFNEYIKRAGVNAREWDDFINLALDTILYHHERWDGNGYPFGLSGREIPVCARICAIADSYRHMTSEQPYRAVKSHQEAYAAITREAGKRFDPMLVRVFRQCGNEFAGCLFGTNTINGFPPWTL